MKTGIIVYVVGNPNNEASFNEKSARENLGIDADLVSFVFSGERNTDIAYEWWTMTVKGMSRIVCMAGEMIKPSVVRLTGRELQLSGL